MGFILYLIGAVVSCFFAWKKYSKKMLESLGRYETWGEKIEFWQITSITLFYPVAIPIMIFWSILEIAYNKFNNNLK